MTNHLFSRVVRFGVPALSWSLVAWAQIAQNAPQLCGAAGGGKTSPLEGISAYTSASRASSTLLITPPGSQQSVEVHFSAGTINQVCRIPGDRFLVFGSFRGENTFETIMIVERSGKIVDSMLGYSPSVSPDQRWLVRRDFYPAQSELIPSEEYLLYDLAKDNVGNRHPGMTPYLDGAFGRVVYPAVVDGTPFNHFDLPDGESHSSRSEGFHWAPDSSAFLFADSVKDQFSIVLVDVSGKTPRALVHSVTASEACVDGGSVSVAGEFDLSDAEVGPDGTARTVLLRFRSNGVCRPKELVLHPEDFRPAAYEVHRPDPEPTGVSIEIKPPERQ